MGLRRSLEQPRTETLVLMLAGIVTLLTVAVLALFLRTISLENRLLTAIQSLQAPSVPAGLATGAEAPGFQLLDLQGKTVSLTDYAGRQVLLAFTSTQCSACTAAYPAIETFSTARSDVQVVLVSRGTADQNRQLAEDQGFTFPVLTWDDEVAQNYKVPGTPFFYLIGGDGVIRDSGFANTLEQLEALTEGQGDG